MAIPLRGALARTSALGIRACLPLRVRFRRETADRAKEKVAYEESKEYQKWFKLGRPRPKVQLVRTPEQKIEEQRIIKTYAREMLRISRAIGRDMAIKHRLQLAAINELPPGFLREEAKKTDETPFPPPTIPDWHPPHPKIAELMTFEQA